MTEPQLICNLQKNPVHHARDVVEELHQAAVVESWLQRCRLQADVLQNCVLSVACQTCQAVVQMEGGYATLMAPLSW